MRREATPLVTATRHRIVILGNPAAGKGEAETLAAEVAAWARAEGHRVDVFMSSRAGQLRARAAALPLDAHRLVIAGGDGTVNEVVNGLRDPARTPLAILPCGTGNVLARELLLPRHPAGIIDLLQRGHCRPIRLGLANDRRFLLFVGIGLDAMVVAELKRRGGRGYRGYLRPLIAVIRRYRPPRLQLELRGRRPANVTFLLASKCRNYVGPILLTPGATPQAKAFQTCALTAGSRRQLLATALGAVLSRGRRIPHSFSFTCTSLVVKAVPPVPIQVDGDFGGYTPATIRTTPSAVMVLVRPRPR